jgi:hypothetical protein
MTYLVVVVVSDVVVVGVVVVVSLHKPQGLAHNLATVFGHGGKLPRRCSGCLFLAE